VLSFGALPKQATIIAGCCYDGGHPLPPAAPPGEPRHRNASRSSIRNAGASALPLARKLT